MDTRGEVLKHIKLVRHNINVIKKYLRHRGEEHDKSKLNSPEYEIFEEYTPKLKATTYNSDEYKKYLKEMKVALDHHYSVNRHHPEHFKNGINDMNLVDVIEMLSDWMAATLKHDDGDIYKSIEINRKRFSISDQLAQILINTVKDYEDEFNNIK
jgi:hypothetical protein